MIYLNIAVLGTGSETAAAHPRAASCGELLLKILSVLSYICLVLTRSHILNIVRKVYIRWMS